MEILNITKISVARTNEGKVLKVEFGSITFKEDVRKVGNSFVTVICCLLKTCI